MDLVTALATEPAMPRRRAIADPMGPIIAENLLRLGYADVVVRTTELARLIQEKTGKSMTRQRISAIVNAVRVEPETIRTLAEAIGVDPSELTKR